jgi:non-ribosomal peptide synthetase component E (peptide arylation enzyme)
VTPKLAASNRPKRVDCLAVAKTPHGKMDKKALRARFWEEANS